MSITYIDDIIEEIIKQYYEHQEKELAEIIAKYDFIVGSDELKYMLMDILPDDANIIYSKYVPNSTMCYAIKKFDITDMLNTTMAVTKPNKELKSHEYYCNKQFDNSALVKLDKESEDIKI